MTDGKLFRKEPRIFETNFCTYLIRFLDLLIKNKVSTVIMSLLTSIKQIC